MGLFGPSGGTGGGFHINQGGPSYSVQTVRVWAGRYINGIQILYSITTSGVIEYGKVLGVADGQDFQGLGAIDFDLAPGEHITSISGKYGYYVDSLTIVTTVEGHVAFFGGSGGSADYYYQVDAGEEIYEFFGNSGLYVDSIGVRTRIFL
jgi:hypothetical protein